MPIINELDQTYLVPVEASTLATLFAESKIDGCHQRVAYGEDDLPILKDGDMTIVEVLEQMPGGCLVRVAPMMGDAHELASFLADREEAATLVACELAADRALAFVEAVGGLAAARFSGRWRPIHAPDRQVWGAHLMRCNAQKLRLEADRSRAQALHLAPATVLRTGRKAA